MSATRFVAASILSMVVLSSGASAGTGAGDVGALMQAAVRLPCLAAPASDLKRLAARLPGARSTRNWVQFGASGITKRRMLFEALGGVLSLEFTGEVGSPGMVRAQFDGGGGKQPLLLAIADHGCIIHTARRLHRDGEGAPSAWSRWMARFALPACRSP